MKWVLYLFKNYDERDDLFFDSVSDLMIAVSAAVVSEKFTLITAYSWDGHDKSDAPHSQAHIRIKGCHKYGSLARSR